MYHRYIHTFGTHLFHDDLVKNIEEIKIASPETLNDQETKEEPRGKVDIEFDTCFKTFTFHDKIRQITITIFPAPNEK